MADRAGIGLCLAAGVGILSVLGITFPAWLDAAITSVLVSRHGSNFISDLFGKLRTNKQPIRGFYPPGGPPFVAPLPL